MPPLEPDAVLARPDADDMADLRKLLRLVVTAKPVEHGIGQHRPQPDMDRVREYLSKLRKKASYGPARPTS